MAQSENFVGEIAISLDDAPMPGTVIFNGVARTKEIIKKLQAVNSPPIGIFALGIHAQHKAGMDRLAMYAQAGHLIANHTYSHYRLGEVTTQDFIKDIQKAHQCLQELSTFQRLFRFPYLYEGDNLQQRQETLDALTSMGYKEGYVTVCNYDFHINYLLVQAVKKGKNINYQKLRNLYLKIIWDCIAYYDQMARQVLQRKVKHVLLLHENDLAALYIGDLIEFIRGKGWKVISIEEAYTDVFADLPLTTAYSQEGRIAAIAYEQGLDPQGLSGPYPTCDHIANLLEKENVFSDPSTER